MNDLSKVRVSALASCYRAERFLPHFFESCRKQTIGSELEVVLVLNEPTAAESELVADAVADLPCSVTVVDTPGRETFSASINRAIAAAHGEYLCIWNVDDLRTPDSTASLARALDENPDADFSYGDFVIARRWPSEEGKVVVAPPFEPRRFVRSMLLGPFFMWRRDAPPNRWGLDEQLKVVGDFDFAIRLALAGEGVRASVPLGYYLDEGEGLSTSKEGDQRIEAAVVLRRYGIYDKVDLRYLRRGQSYSVDSILTRDGWRPVDEVVSGRYRYRTGMGARILAAPRTVGNVLYDVRYRLNSKLAGVGQAPRGR